VVVVIDANIIISASLKIKGRIAELIFNYSSTINYVVPAFILSEIKENEEKICTAGKISKIEFNQNLAVLLTKLLLINDDEISDATFKKSFDLTKSIDPNDTIYIALAISLNALFWTGDLKLLRGLKRKGFAHIITTLDFEQILKGI
jgi:predicted nucleic acid-binding protein